MKLKKIKTADASYGIAYLSLFYMPKSNEGAISYQIWLNIVFSLVICSIL